MLIERNEPDKDDEVVQGQSRKEIDQARAMQLQKAAFNAQVAKRTDDAIESYKQLLDTDFVSQISPDHPGYRMRYAALKNLTRLLPRNKGK